MSASAATAEIRGVLLPLQGGQLLLPNATVSEVVGFREPTPIDGHSHDWLLGRVEWRQQTVPVVSFERLTGLPTSETGHRVRLAICNTLNGSTECPHIGILLRSIPHLTRVNDESVSPLDSADELPPMVLRRVTLNAREAWIPDLDQLERSILEVIG